MFFSGLGPIPPVNEEPGPVDKEYERKIQDMYAPGLRQELNLTGAVIALVVIGVIVAIVGGMLGKW